MTRNALLLLALYALVQIKPATSTPVSNITNTPVPIPNDNALQLLFHHNTGNESDATWKNKVEALEEHARRPRDAKQAEVRAIPVCSLEITSEIFYQNTPVSCPMLKVLSQHTEMNDTAEVGFIVDPLADTVNATANVSVAFVNLAIPLKMQCVMWYNVSCEAHRHVVACDLTANFSKPVTEPGVCAVCDTSERRVPVKLAILVGLLTALFMMVVLRLFYKLLCYKCCHRRSETNVVVTFTTERDFDALLEKQFKTFFEAIKNAQL